MKDYIEERVLELANHIVETGATVRSTAAKFRVSKSEFRYTPASSFKNIRSTSENEKKILEKSIVSRAKMVSA